MGTNYYVRVNVCEKCQRPEDKFHIGKSSWGWKFLFNRRFKNFKEWVNFLKEQPDIVDEYGTPHELQKFLNFIESKQSEKHSHSPAYGGWIDEDGYNFSDAYEFS